MLAAIPNADAAPTLDLYVGEERRTTLAATHATATEALAAAVLRAGDPGDAVEGRVVLAARIGGEAFEFVDPPSTALRPGGVLIGLGAWSRVCSMAWRLANISLATGLRITFANFEAGRVPSRVSYKAVLSFGSALLLSQSAPRARFATRNGRAIALSGKDSEFERRPSQVTVLFAYAVPMLLCLRLRI